MRAGDGDAEVIGGWFVSAVGEQVESLEAGEPCTFSMHVRFHAAVEDPIFGFSFRNARDERIFVADSDQKLEGESFAAGDEVVVNFGFHNSLAPERYGVSASVARRGLGEAWLDNRERFRSVIVSATQPRGGIVDLPFDVSLHRQEADDQ
jgi:hypothetical protein